MKSCQCGNLNTPEGVSNILPFPVSSESELSTKPIENRNLMRTIQYVCLRRCAG